MICINNNVCIIFIYLDCFSPHIIIIYDLQICDLKTIKIMTDFIGTLGTVLAIDIFSQVVQLINCIVLFNIAYYLSLKTSGKYNFQYFIPYKYNQ